jgi:hypothetical protein
MKPKLLAALLLSISAPALADTSCSGVDPFPGRNPSYCKRGYTCYVSDPGKWHESHTCCHYSEYSHKVECYSRNVNSPPRRRFCHPRIGCEDGGR